ncbi:ankyrin repeat domain-containing protein [Sinomicrobium weinanense]|uniref:Ankyrin repeat domain-containing protein n=1 Tax=Sinomicrobium weinanense TaxID=2842200 RepID=A0A926JTG7_9FLAO|nr:ankyrin repeat domain-containing protein [Sinomicrobium weinanense]MBC9797222.1 ankyrin repeat domain-containing protein [Sinomicrobium weinanense]MBU3125565.1 ankyrin repeat domain-containing protein [Sinomicrobium weinanense]
MNETTLKEAIRQKDFANVERCIKADADSFNSLKSYEKESLISGALRHKSFSLILALADSGLLTTDVFELDNWTGSDIWNVLLYTPFEKNNHVIGNSRASKTIDSADELDEESLAFFQTFATRIENIDEAVERQTLLQLAISKNLPVPVLQAIVDNGCPADSYDHSENTLLFQKLTPEVGRWLIDQGLDVNHKNKGNETPLEKAIENNNNELVKALLDNGADLHHTNKEGNSMFYFALVDKVNYDLFDTLCEYDSPNFDETNHTGSSLLFNYIDRLTSAGENQLKYLEKLLEMGADVQQVSTDIYGRTKTPLDAAMGKDAVVFETVLKFYRDGINQTGNDGNTLLHKVCGLDLNFDQAKAKDLYRKVKLLLNKGADPSIRNAEDKTATDLAANDNLKEKTVALLLKYQASA